MDKYLKAAFEGNTAKTVPIVFASNQGFAPAMSVAIASVLQHCSDGRNYDIVVLESNVTESTKRVIQSMAKGRENVSIRFYHALPIIAQYDLKANEHITVETFYRFIIQDVLPDYDKVVYLDGDLVCCCDIAQLYDVDIECCYLAAALDPDMLGNLNLSEERVNYLRQELEMEDPYSYFQAGVLLLNTERMRAAHSTEEWLRFACHRYQFSDQDVLNRYCQGHVKYLDMSWNMLIDCEHYRVPVIIKAAPEAVCSAYMQARQNPKIIHYAGFQKPWKYCGVDFESTFWEYARTTPFYNNLRLGLLKARIGRKLRGT